MTDSPPPFPPCPGPSRIGSPAQRLLPDLRSFLLVEPAIYTWCHDVDGYEALRIVVPEGFMHDFASVPRVLRVLISPVDLGLASIFHDWMYRAGGRIDTLGRRRGDTGWESVRTPWSRRDADRLFARIMREQGVPKWKRRLAFMAVQWFGESGWRVAEAPGPVAPTGP